jgi:hypothetical protein
VCLGEYRFSGDSYLAIAITGRVDNGVKIFFATMVLESLSYRP